MARRYGQFQSLLNPFENEPKKCLTKQKWNDTPFIIRGEDQGVPIWYYILVPFNQLSHLKELQRGESIDCTKYGQIIQYLDKENEMISLSGWGINPPLRIERWFNQHYDKGILNEKIFFNDQSIDDIRLCTIERSRINELIGITRFYHKQEHFHYLILSDQNDQSLAFRSGLKNDDRIISINGFNIEEETIEQITSHFNNPLNLLLQILVCNPSTYQYFQTNHFILHDHLPQVQHLPSVYQTSLIDDQQMKKDLLEKKSSSRFEDLPNELFYDIFDYLNIEECHYTFYNLNNRLNKLLFSRTNVSFIYDDQTDPLVIQLYSFQIIHLIVDTFHRCHLKEYSHLQSLIFYNRNSDHLKEIECDVLPNLVHLSFLLKYDFQAPIELIDQIFSNRFLFLRDLNLGRIEKCSFNSWSKCFSLRRLSIRSDQLMIIENILLSCPNLKSFLFHILQNRNHSATISSSINSHPLEQFTLWTHQIELKSDLIDALLSYTPNLKRFYLQTKSTLSFFQLMSNIHQRLNYLSKFDCFIQEFIKTDQRMDNLQNIFQLSSSFHRIKCIEENQSFRIFST